MSSVLTVNEDRLPDTSRVSEQGLPNSPSAARNALSSDGTNGSATTLRYLSPFFSWAMMSLYPCIETDWSEIVITDSSSRSLKFWSDMSRGEMSAIAERLPTERPERSSKARRRRSMTKRSPSMSGMATSALKSESSI